MTFTNSPLVDYVKISPNSTNPRRGKIKKITIHHVAGNLSVEALGDIFAVASRKASSNYGVDNQGRVGMYVEEKNRAWTSSNADNDNQAVTIEVANIGGSPDWKVSDVALNKTIELCVDICKRNGIEKLIYTGDATGNLTRHNMFAATICPGPYLQSKFPYIADEVNKRLNAPKEEPASKVLYRVQTGAFRNRSNADRLAVELKGKGFDTYIVQADGLFKVQVGAYSVKSNADAMAARLKAAGYDTYITTQGGTPAGKPSAPPAPRPLRVGDKVRVRQGARTYDGKPLASFVYNTTYDVLEVRGDRVVIGKGTAVTAAVHIDDLILQ